MIIVQSLWIGSDLGTMERLCINSFLKHGYEYHLYVYEDIQNIPSGVIIKDANEIVDKSEVFTYNNKSFSAISNLFRFTLLYKKGGWWVDTDMVCTKYYDDTNDKYLFTSESNKKYNENKINAGIVKMPLGDPMLLEAIQRCQEAKEKILKGEIVWGIGPSTVKFLIEKYQLEEYVKPWTFANSCSGHHFKTIIDTSFDTSKDKTLKGFELKYFNQIENKPENNHFIHLWNEHWRRNDIDKETQYPEDCLYEQLKKLYSPE